MTPLSRDPSSMSPPGAHPFIHGHVWHTHAGGQMCTWPLREQKGIRFSLILFIVCVLGKGTLETTLASTWSSSLKKKKNPKHYEWLIFSKNWILIWCICKCFWCQSSMSDGTFPSGKEDPRKWIHHILADQSDSLLRHMGAGDMAKISYRDFFIGKITITIFYYWFSLLFGTFPISATRP